MKIFILDSNIKTANILKLYFRGIDDVTVVHEKFASFMDNTDVDCVVSPANSYGLMDGGYDKAISEWFGWDLMKKVQTYIMKHYFGEQPIGTSFIIDTGIQGIKLIHTPTMRIPSEIKEPLVVYQCMRITLMTAIENGVKRVVIPVFGGGCGNVSPQVIGKMMYKGYEQIMNPPSELSWEYAERWKPEWEDTREIQVIPSNYEKDTVLNDGSHAYMIKKQQYTRYHYVSASGDVSRPIDKDTYELLVSYFCAKED